MPAGLALAATLEVAQEGIVLLKNANTLLPLSTSLSRLAVIGGQAHIGVLSDGIGAAA